MSRNSRPGNWSEKVFSFCPVAGAAVLSLSLSLSLEAACAGAASAIHPVRKVQRTIDQARRDFTATPPIRDLRTRVWKPSELAVRDIAGGDSMPTPPNRHELKVRVTD